MAELGADRHRDRPESTPSSSFQAVASSLWELASSFRKISTDQNGPHELSHVAQPRYRNEADEMELQWAAIDQLPHVQKGKDVVV